MKVIKDHCSGENSTHKYNSVVGQLQCPVQLVSDSQKYDLYINEEGLYELVFSSQQLLGKEFSAKHCCNVMFPHIRQQLIDKMKEKITDRRQRYQDTDHSVQKRTSAGRD